MYRSYKEFNGYSTAFRQWRADSHCRFVHGYALRFKVWFEGELDERNWVVDFGGLKELKQWLKDSFDHKTVLDTADPKKGLIEALVPEGIAEVVYFDGVGCEKFAEHALKKADEIVQRITGGRCYCISCEVSEHGANSAIFLREDFD